MFDDAPDAYFAKEVVLFLILHKPAEIRFLGFRDIRLAVREKDVFTALKFVPPQQDIWYFSIEKPFML